MVLQPTKGILTLSALLLVLFCSACANGNGQENGLAYKKDAESTEANAAIYGRKIEELDRELQKVREREEEGSLYRENIHTIYLYNDDINGVLQASYDAEGIASLRLSVFDKGASVPASFYCCFLKDGNLWFTYADEEYEGGNIPNYLVDEAVLRYSRLENSYTASQGNQESVLQDFEERLNTNSKTSACEFWYVGGILYQIDREKGILTDMTEKEAVCLAEFLLAQPERILSRLLVNEAVLEQVEEWKPEGYCLLYEEQWENIAVCDLNEDGKQDYVLVLYPEDFEEEKRYEELSPYEHSSEYYASGFWLLLSSQAGYEPLLLSSSIEYWDTALTFVRLEFVAERILELEYFVGRAPFSNAVIQFQYDEEDKNFYVYRTYYREDKCFLIGNEHNHGKTDMEQYFAYPGYTEDAWKYSENILLENGNFISYYSSNFLYECSNPITEGYLNGKIKEQEWKMTEAFQELYQNTDISFYPSSLFYNDRLISGYIECTGYEVEWKNNGRREDNAIRSFRVSLPVMLDIWTGEYVEAAEQIEKETVLELFLNWGRPLTPIENDKTIEEYAAFLEEGWESANSIEDLAGCKEGAVTLRIAQEGMLVGFLTYEEGAVIEISSADWIIDREHFIGTGLWEYMKPDWLGGRENK